MSEWMTIRHTKQVPTVSLNKQVIDVTQVYHYCLILLITQHAQTISHWVLSAFIYLIGISDMRE